MQQLASDMLGLPSHSFSSQVNSLKQSQSFGYSDYSSGYGSHRGYGHEYDNSGGTDFSAKRLKGVRRIVVNTSYFKINLSCSNIFS